MKDKKNLIQLIDKLVKSDSAEEITKICKAYDDQIRVPSNIKRDVYQAFSMSNYKKIIQILNKNPHLKIAGLSKKLKEDQAYARFLVKHKIQYRGSEHADSNDTLHGKDGRGGMIGKLFDLFSI